MFIRKRDPRYKSHIAQQSAAAISKVTSQATPRKSNTPARSSTPNFVEQEWQKASESKFEENADLEWAAAEADEDSEEWECVACGKTFRSEAAWDSHERSRKHMQAVERLKQHMLEEDEVLELGEHSGEDDVGDEEEVFHDAEDGEIKVDEAGENLQPSPADEEKQAEENQEIPLGKTRKKTRNKQKSNVQSRTASPSPPKIEKKSRGRRKMRSPSLEQVMIPVDSPVDALTNGVETPPESSSNVGDPPTAPSEMTKREKRRAKEAAKKAQASVTKLVGAIVVDQGWY